MRKITRLLYQARTQADEHDYIFSAVFTLPIRRPVKTPAIQPVTTEEDVEDIREALVIFLRERTCELVYFKIEQPKIITERQGAFQEWDVTVNAA